jgi:hypothetical protein
MTQNDWVGLILTVVTFIGMIVIYVYALLPSNREKLEAQRFIPLEDDHFEMEDKK